MVPWPTVFVSITQNLFVLQCCGHNYPRIRSTDQKLDIMSLKTCKKSLEIHQIDAPRTALAAHQGVPDGSSADPA